MASFFGFTATTSLVTLLTCGGLCTTFSLSTLRSLSFLPPFFFSPLFFLSPPLLLLSLLPLLLSLPAGLGHLLPFLRFASASFLAFSRTYSVGSNRPPLEYPELRVGVALLLDARLDAREDALEFAIELARLPFLLLWLPFLLCPAFLPFACPASPLLSLGLLLTLLPLSLSKLFSPNLFLTLLSMLFLKLLNSMSFLLHSATLASSLLLILTMALDELALVLA